MKIIALFFLILYLSSSFTIFTYADTECPVITTIEDRRLSNNSLRLVQYNVEWLFIDYYSPMQCPGSGCTWHTEDIAKTHMSYVADVVNYLKPDILNLCEVEGCDELNMLSSMMGTSFKPYLIKGTDSATGQNVGLITKVDPIISLYRTNEKVNYPLSNSKCGNTTSTGTTSVSKHYITEYKLYGIDIALIGAHLLAIPTDPSRCVQREAQAQVLQNVVKSYIDKKYEVIVIGDMNDYDAEILDMNSNKPTSRVLDILKGYDGEFKGKYELINVAYHINQTNRYSDWYDSDNNCNTKSNKDYSMIDHILVSPNINKYIDNVFIYHGYDEYCDKLNSDHYPVVVDFKF